nr:MAG TPA: protein of unknown function (DUF4834) [Caudoviricetes sp.]
MFIPGLCILRMHILLFFFFIILFIILLYYYTVLGFI